MLQLEARRAIRREALTGAVSSAAVNALLNSLTYRGATAVPITVDSISAGEPTLFSRSIPSELILCAILGSIAFFKIRKRARREGWSPAELLDRPYFFFGLRVVAFFSMFWFGLLVTSGVLVQKWLGGLALAPAGAVALATCISALSSWFINASTMRAVLRPE